MTRLLLLVFLAGCAAPALPTPAAVPAELLVCPDAVVAPPPPPAPRTVTQIVAWSTRLVVALNGTTDARRECARRLDRLNEWISAHPGMPG